MSDQFSSFEHVPSIGIHESYGSCVLDFAVTAVLFLCGCINSHPRRLYMKRSPFFKKKIICGCEHMCVGSFMCHGAHVEVRGQLAGAFPSSSMCVTELFHVCY